MNDNPYSQELIGHRDTQPDDERFSGQPPLAPEDAALNARMRALDRREIARTGKPYPYITFDLAGRPKVVNL